MVHTVKGFSIVTEAEIDVFWNSLALLLVTHIFMLLRLPVVSPCVKCPSSSLAVFLVLKAVSGPPWWPSGCDCAPSAGAWVQFRVND